MSSDRDAAIAAHETECFVMPQTVNGSNELLGVHQEWKHLRQRRPNHCPQLKYE